MKVMQGNQPVAHYFYDKALKELEEKKLSLLIMTDIFRKCSRAFLMNCDLPNAFFSSDAIKIAAEVSESNHQKVTDALTDYTMYLRSTGKL